MIKGTVKIFDPEKRHGFVQTELSQGDIRIWLDGHVATDADGIFRQVPPPQEIVAGDEVELPIVISGPKGLYAPAWRLISGTGALVTIDDVDGLDVGVLKFFADAKGYGFIVAEGGEEFFAHAENYREVLPDGSLKSFKKGELCGLESRKDSPVKFVHGSGRGGKPAAKLWLLAS